MLPKVPDQIREYIRRVFSQVNDTVSKKLSINPNAPEESLDISFIESLSEFAGPKIVSTNWAVRIAVHFIGNIRHFRRYEIADIGVMIVFKRASKVVGRKLALLQSKRLYPLNYNVIELDDFDYELGLALVTRENSDEATIFSKVQYEFDQNSAYGAIKSNDRQCQAIQSHFQETNVPVHYMMYNPVVIPWTFAYPISDSAKKIPRRELGTRIVTSSTVHDILEEIAEGHSPKLIDFQQTSENMKISNYRYGWSLEDFIADEVLRCREGYPYSKQRDAGLRRLFSRKSGPIFCVVEITIENQK